MKFKRNFSYSEGPLSMHWHWHL